MAYLYIFNLLGVTLQILSAYYKCYMSQQTHRGAEVLHGLPTANRTDAKDEKYKSPTQMISSNKIWHQDQQNPSRTQSISWLNVIRLFSSANIALELFRICSKSISPFFIISTTVADQRLLLGLINTLANLFLLSFHIRRAHQTGAWSLVWISCWIVFETFVGPDNGLISSIFVTC